MLLEKSSAGGQTWKRRQTILDWKSSLIPQTISQSTKKVFWYKIIQGTLLPLPPLHSQISAMFWKIHLWNNNDFSIHDIWETSNQIKQMYSPTVVLRSGLLDQNFKKKNINVDLLDIPNCPILCSIKFNYSLELRPFTPCVEFGLKKLWLCCWQQVLLKWTFILHQYKKYTFNYFRNKIIPKIFVKSNLFTNCRCDTLNSVQCAPLSPPHLYIVLTNNLPAKICGLL